MSEEPETSQDQVLLENESTKPTLKQRFRFIGILCIIAAALWVVINYAVPSPFNTESVPLTESAIFSSLNNQPSSTDKIPSNDMVSTEHESKVMGESTEMDEASSPVVKDAPTDTQTDSTAAESPAGSAVAEENIAASPSPTPISTSAPTVSPMLAANNALEDKNEEAVAKIEQLSQNLSTKDQKISTLKCALQLQTGAHQTEALSMALTQCYAVMVDAGISQGDIRTLTEASLNQGVPARDAMLQSFHQAIAPALRVREQGHVEESGWYRALRQRVVDSFIVRKTGWQEGSNTAAIIGRAEVYLGKDRMNDAYNEIQNLSENAKKPFKEWLEMVEIRHAQKRVTDALVRAAESKNLETRHDD